jgi:hypothetical protein
MTQVLAVLGGGTTEAPVIETAAALAEIAHARVRQVSLPGDLSAERAAAQLLGALHSPGSLLAVMARVLPDAQDKRRGVTVDENRVCAFRAFRQVVRSGCRRVAHGGGARGAGIAWMSLACAAGPGEGMGMPGTGPGG